MTREVVRGYCWPQSVGASERVGLHMSSSGGRPVRVEVARVGAEREVVFSSDVVAADDHETPKDASSRGCGWRVALTLDVDWAWRSGYYGSAGWPDWERPFIEWAEREGYEIAVCTNADLEQRPEVLESASLYLSVGHDEYWSRGMRDTVEAFIARGGNAAFFSGNTSLWQVRVEGDDHDVMVGYKSFFKNDPVMGTDREREVTTFWSDVLVGRPENEMTGVSFTRGDYHRIGRNVTSGLGGYTVHRADHWIFDGTGLGYGDVLGAGATVVGYECDGCVFTYRDGLPYPTGEDGTPSTFEILGTCPTQHFTRETAPRPPKPGEPSELEYIASRVFGTREPEAMERIRHGHAVLGAYTNEAGATVMTSGSTDWAHGLAGRDPQIEQITRNVLTRLG